MTTGISFGLAGLISTTATVKSSYVPSAPKTVGIYAAILVSHGLVSTFGIHILRYLNNTSILLHSAGVTSIAIAVLVKAPTHQSAKFVFATFNDGTGATGYEGWSVRASPAYVACCGALVAQYTLTGFDASAHLSEETHNASWSAPIGVISSVGFSALFGLFVMLSFLFGIQNFQNTITSSYGQPVLQIFVDIFGDDGAVVLMCVIMTCVWHCGLFSLTSNSRMMFAFARDGGIVRIAPYPLNSPLSHGSKHADISNSPISSTVLTTGSAPLSALSGSLPSWPSVSPYPLWVLPSPLRLLPPLPLSAYIYHTESLSLSASFTPGNSGP